MRNAKGTRALPGVAALLLSPVLTLPLLLMRGQRQLLLPQLELLLRSLFRIKQLLLRCCEVPTYVVLIALPTNLLCRCCCCCCRAIVKQQVTIGSSSSTPW